MNDARTEAADSFESPMAACSLGDQSTRAEGMSSVSDLGALAANLDETLELTDLSARYELGEVIGRGGMGEVLLARDKRLERPVAIKRILGEGARSATALRRFLTEARSLAQLNHFNIIQAYDYGRDAQGPFLILEYVAGKSLREKLKAGRMEMEQAVDMVCQLCDGLSAAHKQGIVYRDVKPANVLLTEGGEPQRTPNGWNVEAAIPLEMLVKNQSENWHSFQMTPVLTDVDDPADEPLQMVWRGTAEAAVRNTNFGQFVRAKPKPDGTK